MKPSQRARMLKFRSNTAPSRATVADDSPATVAIKAIAHADLAGQRAAEVLRQLAAVDDSDDVEMIEIPADAFGAVVSMLLEMARDVAPDLVAELSSNVSSPAASLPEYMNLNVYHRERQAGASRTDARLAALAAEAQGQRWDDVSVRNVLGGRTPSAIPLPYTLALQAKKAKGTASDNTSDSDVTAGSYDLALQRKGEVIPGGTAAYLSPDDKWSDAAERRATGR